ncbi:MULTISPECIES: hypothetical protein [Nocardia]|jgi:hypothetical protein|uniref:Uncharacterized protein n=1 Tax=Nocardia fluminea TaxID=134984 RepID=A0A2N3VHS4_9NOCA|nr:hypothetical protein [Nocardia fluminea]PKV81149.1 hypothetical protein ATK86_5611 [Nocardia fluminea]
MTQNMRNERGLSGHDLATRMIAAFDTLSELEMLAARCAADGISLRIVCDAINSELADAVMGAPDAAIENQEELLAALTSLAQSSAMRAYCR